MLAEPVAEAEPVGEAESFDMAMLGAGAGVLGLGLLYGLYRRCKTGKSSIDDSDSFKRQLC